MQVSSINNTQSFKGLWGNTVAESSGGENFSIYKETKSYYPFKDESKESILKIKSMDSHSHNYHWYEIGSNVSSFESVDIKPRLSFTKAEYLDYIKNSNLGATNFHDINHPIEKELFDKGLYKHLNKYKECMQNLKIEQSFSYKLKKILSNLKNKIKF